MLAEHYIIGAPATPVLYTLSLHDALPICLDRGARHILVAGEAEVVVRREVHVFAAADHRGVVRHTDRKSTRLNSSHQISSYAVFCLKKKNHSRISYLATLRHALPTLSKTE